MLGRFGDMLLAEGLGPAAASPENQELFKKYVNAFAAGPNRLNLTPVGGGAFGWETEEDVRIARRALHRFARTVTCSMSSISAISAGVKP